jgi:hypothetical protein
MGEGKRSALRVEFDGQIRLEFHGANVTSDAGLLAYRELDEALGLTTEVDELSIYDPRTGRNTQHSVTAMIRQSVYSRPRVGFIVTKLSCRTFKDNQTRLQLFALAYNLANFLRRLALPQDVEHWSLTTLREKLVKIGAKVTRHAKYVTFQLAEVAVPRRLFAAILDRIARLAIPPPRVT